MMRKNVRPSRSVLAAAVAAAASAIGFFPETASAQGAERPSVRVSPVILAEPEVETPLSVQVTSATELPGQTYLRIKGLPLSAKLSEGHVVTPGVWAVPLAALSSLRVMAPLAGSGRTELSLALVAIDGGVLAESRASLVVAPAWLLGSQTFRQSGPRTDGGTLQTSTAFAPEPPKVEPPKVDAPRVANVPAVPAPAAPQIVVPAPVAATPPPPVAVAALPPSPPPAPQPPAARPIVVAPAATVGPAAIPPAAVPALKAEDRARAESMMQRGDAFLAQGNMAAARQFYRRAADIGFAPAAVRLGGTFDPAELASLAVVGIQPDLKEARMWYERARELGAGEAAARLSRLQAR